MTIFLIIFINLIFILYGTNYSYKYIMSTISALLFMIYLINIYKYKYEMFLILAPFYISQLGVVLSNLIIEKGILLKELMLYSYTTGSTTKLVFYNIIFFEIAVNIFYAVNKFENLKFKFNKKVCNVLLSIVLCIVLISFAGFIFDGVPIFMGIDRIQYVRSYQSFLFNKISGQLYISTFIIGIIAGISYVKNERKNFKKCVVIFIFILIYFLLRGDKFSGLLNIIYLFIIPIYLQLYKFSNFKIKLSKLIIIGAFIGLVFIYIINFHYSHINKSNSANRISERIAAQGQVWWAIDKNVSNGYKASDSEIVKEVESYFNKNIDKSDLGLNKLMKVIAPTTVYSSFLGNGVNFTMGYPAIGLYLYGYLGLVFFQIFFGTLLCICLSYTYKTLISGEYFRCIISGKIYIELIGSLSMGNLYNILSREIVLYIIIIILMNIVKVNKVKHLN